ncbi:MAG: hypothetical protein ACO3GE_02895 [Steroidobacteraceae bacterium]
MSGGLQRLAGFTITSADPVAAAASYASQLGYVVRAEGTITPLTALQWGTPKMAGRHYVEMQVPASKGPGCFVRFVEQEAVSGMPRLGHGWNAMEVLCQSPYELAKDFEGSEFRVIIPPRPLPFDPDLHAMQVIGPAGELIYFTSLPTHKELFDLRPADRRVDEPFIAILGGPDMAAMLKFYSEKLATRTLPPAPVNVRIINDEFELGDDARVPLGIVKLPKFHLIEIDEHPSASQPRPRRDGELPPGIAMVSFDVEGITDARPVQVVVGAAGEWLELPAPN